MHVPARGSLLWFHYIKFHDRPNPPANTHYASCAPTFEGVRPRPARRGGDSMCTIGGREPFWGYYRQDRFLFGRGCIWGGVTALHGFAGDWFLLGLQVPNRITPDPCPFPSFSCFTWIPKTPYIICASHRQWWHGDLPPGPSTFRWEVSEFEPYRVLRKLIT